MDSMDTRRRLHDADGTDETAKFVAMENGQGKL